MQREYRVSEEKIIKIFDLLKSDNGASKETIAKILSIGVATVFRAVKELERRKWIKEKSRIGIVVQYQITKKD